MSANNILFIFICIVFLGSCSSSAKVYDRHEPLVKNSSRVMIADYCDKGDGFMKNDNKYLKFVQFVDSSIVIYRMQYPEGEMLFCAHSVDNESLKPILDSRGIPYSHYLIVIP